MIAMHDGGITATASSGTPAQAGVPSAVAGQTITVTQAAGNYVAANPVGTLVSSGVTAPMASPRARWRHDAG